MRFRNQGEDLIYCSLDDSVRDSTDLVRHAAQINVELLYPMSGLGIEEPVLQPGRIGVLLRQGQTAQVLRNLCWMVYKNSTSDWSRIAALRKRLFHLSLGIPTETSRGAIDLDYEQDGVKERLALTSSGRGFQQMLLIFAYLYSHKNSVLLVDEPDAHLEILRQKQVFVLLRDIAHENGSQVILVTHSEVILDAALDTNLTLLLEGKADNLARKTDIRESLKLYSTSHYVRARQRGYVLYVEGGTDIDILRAWAARLNHPSLALWDELPNVYYVENVQPSTNSDTELEKVEGGFGIPPRDHFNSLRKLLPVLRGLAILDNDGKPKADYDDPHLCIRHWKRYEIENYFITPHLLLSFVESRNPDLGLFSIQRDQAQELLHEHIRNRVFDGNNEEFLIYRDAAPDAARLIWDARTQAMKLSAFAEDYFRLLRDHTGLEMLLTKGEFHHLAPSPTQRASRMKSPRNSTSSPVSSATPPPSSPPDQTGQYNNRDMTRRHYLLSLASAAGLSAATAPPIAPGAPNSPQRLALIAALRQKLPALTQHFTPHTHAGKDGTPMPYRLFRPSKTPAAKIPLILYLHGAGGLGDDNRKQIAGGNLFGSHLWALPEIQKQHPSFILAPQTSFGWIRYDAIRTPGGPRPNPIPGFGKGAALVFEIVTALRQELPIDERRIYVMGNSMGGGGTWHFLAHKPGLFAAAIPVAGGASNSSDPMPPVVGTPLWNFHGDADQTVPVEVSRTRIDALRKAGGNPSYTEYPGIGHNANEWAFSEPALPNWLFAQRRPSTR